MVRYCLTIFLLLGACGSPPGASKSIPSASSSSSGRDSLPEFQYRKGHATGLYGNEDGVRVAVVPVVRSSDPSATGYVLVRATGTTSEYDGLVLLGKKSRSRDRHSIHVHVRGEPFEFMVHLSASEKWYFSGFKSGHDDDEVLRAIDESVDVEEILRLREEQRSTDARKLEAVTRADKERWQNVVFTKLNTTAARHCPNVSASIDWSTVSDELLDETSIAGRCLPIATAANNFCRLHPHLAAALGERISFECSFAGHPNEVEAAVEIVNSETTVRYSPGKSRQEPERRLVDAARKLLDAKVEVFALGAWRFILKYERDKASLFVGTGTAFYPSDVAESFYFSTLNLQEGSIRALLIRDSRTWQLSCGSQKKPLQLLSKKERDAVLRGATFEKQPKWKREPYFLSRDSRGTYYYVDKYSERFGGKRYRVFVGRRGQLKLTKLKGVVEDSEGTLFSTDSGELRLVVNTGGEAGRQSAVWIRGRKETPLTSVAIRPNLRLIYDELGVYYGDETGFVCE